MSNMMLSVEFLAGTNLSDALVEAKEKARRFDLVYIMFNFNNVQFSIGQNADLKKAEEEYPKKKYIVFS